MVVILFVDTSLLNLNEPVTPTCSVGGGDREWTFWRNYFFHCAYTRYVAGLSIDEIWSDQPTTLPPEQDVSQSQHGDESAGGAEEEVITFDHVETSAASSSFDATSDTAFPSPEPDVDNSLPAVSTTTAATTTTDDQGSTPTGTSSGNNGAGSVGADFELVGADDSDGGELDELEAEIARELEDAL